MDITEWDLIQQNAKKENFRVMLMTQPKWKIEMYIREYEHIPEYMAIINEVIKTRGLCE